MVFARDLPQSFAEAFRSSQEILSTNRELLAEGSLEAEAERIVIGAYQIVLGQRLSRADFLFRFNDRIDEKIAEKVLVLAGRRAQGVPLQHVLGWQEFLGHEYEVNASTLIPRPETEVLVVEAFRKLDHPILGLEVGLGSGVISIELLLHFRELRMRASEVSTEAARLGRRNAIKWAVSDRLEILSIEEPLQVLEPFLNLQADFLIANPPYLDPASGQEVQSEVLRTEPASALFPANGDPLYFYRQIAKGAEKLLKPKGLLFLEIASERAEVTEELFDQRIWKTNLVSDLTGKIRVLIAQKVE